MSECTSGVRHRGVGKSDEVFIGLRAMPGAAPLRIRDLKGTTLGAFLMIMIRREVGNLLRPA